MPDMNHDMYKEHRMHKGDQDMRSDVDTGHRGHEKKRVHSHQHHHAHMVGKLESK